MDTREAIARLIWIRFAPPHRERWDDETHQAEYLGAADQILELPGINRLVKADGLYMPDDLVVVRNRDADEAGDYRALLHSEAVDNSNWEIMHNMTPSDLD